MLAPWGAKRYRPPHRKGNKASSSSAFLSLESLCIRALCEGSIFNHVAHSHQ